ncbi:MAG: hypothetical protein ABDH23_00415 [Endomicrobiia bacterium]
MAKEYRIFYFKLFLLLNLNLVAFHDNELFISDIQKVKDVEYNIVLNNVIVVKNIKLHKLNIGKKEVLELELPSYTAPDGREYPQIRILSEEFQERILKAILENKKENFDFKNNSFPRFEIKKFLPVKKEGKVKVNASLVFEGTLEVICKIVEDENNVYVLWPAEKLKTTDKWIKKIEFLSKPYQKIIEKQLIERYKVYKLEKGI